VPDALPTSADRRSQQPHAGHRAVHGPDPGDALGGVLHRVRQAQQGGVMDVGVWIPNCRHLATPGVIRTTAVRAEELGYDSVWVSDHVVVPRENIKNFGETIFDPLVTLSL